MRVPNLKSVSEPKIKLQIFQKFSIILAIIAQYGRMGHGQ